MAEPMTVGCESLLMHKYRRSGWLRKRGKLNRLIQTVSASLIPWTHMYFVLHKGCIYCYNSERSKASKFSLSLIGYNRVVRAMDISKEENEWVFKIDHVQPHVKPLYLAASSQHEMKDWMKDIKIELVFANQEFLGRLGGAPPVVTSAALSDYSDIEQPIYGDPDHVESFRPNVLMEATSTPFRPPVPSRRSQPPVPMPGMSREFNPRDGTLRTMSLPPREQPSLKPPPPPISSIPRRGASMSDDSSWSSSSEVNLDLVMWYGDAGEGARKLQEQDERGVYLIRPSTRGDNSQVLAVYGGSSAGASVVKYTINCSGTGFFIEVGVEFASLQDLLVHYMDNDLPSRLGLRLTRPFAQ